MNTHAVCADKLTSAGMNSQSSAINSLTCCTALLMNAAIITEKKEMNASESEEEPKNEIHAGV